MLGLIVLLISLLSPARAAEIIGKDGAPMVLIQEGPFLRGGQKGQPHLLLL